MYEIAKRSDLTTSMWNKEADNSPDAWLWHRWESIDAYASWAHSKDISFAVLEKTSGRVAALVPLIRHTRGSKIPYPQVRIEGTGGPAFVKTLGVDQRKRVEAHIARKIQKLAANQGAYRVDLSSPPLSPSNLSSNQNYSTSFRGLGFSDVSTQSWLLQLHGKTKEELWKGMEYRSRKSVNKALRAGVSTRPIQLQDEKIFLRLLTENTKRTGISAKPATYYEQIFRNFLPAGLAKGYCAYTDTNNIHSIHIFGVYKGGAIYWVVASDHYALSVGANNLLQWSAICDLADNGLCWYESGEAFPNEQNGKVRRISDFKKSFGGALVPYHRGTLRCRPFVAATYDCMRVLRKNLQHVKR
ncbi:MAG: hypothetical protein CMM32_06865 [Rhodospirillaceae bacterium]|nr:hypothetical protein [Rhodospirillaceae bacterium]